MIYCKFGNDSDVCLFGDVGDYTCCACRLIPENNGSRGNTKLSSPEAIIIHMSKHTQNNHKYPEYVLNKLTEDLALFYSLKLKRAKIKNHRKNSEKLAKQFVKETLGVSYV